MLGGVFGLEDEAFCWLQGMYSHLTPRFSQRSHCGVAPEHLTCRRRHSVHAMGVRLLRTTGASSVFESAPLAGFDVALDGPLAGSDGGLEERREVLSWLERLMAGCGGTGGGDGGRRAGRGAAGAAFIG